MRATSFHRVLGHPKSAGLLELGGTPAGAYLLRRGLFMPWELSGLLDEDTVRIGMRRLDPLGLLNAELRPLPANSHACVSILEATGYMRNQLLRDTDWASMAHGLEVRTPLVDSVLLRRLAPLVVGDTGVRKADLALCPSVPLPEEIAGRAKTGFETPIASWQRRRAAPAGAEHRPPLSAPWARQWAREIAAA
jgi:asparagine synthase (glutamine-hydrolysing)